MEPLKFYKFAQLDKSGKITNMAQSRDEFLNTSGTYVIELIYCHNLGDEILGWMPYDRKERLVDTSGT